MDSSIDKKEELRQQLRAAALEYHQIPRPGKIAVTPPSQVLNQRDLALAYSPGVAAPCEEIVKDPANAYKYTARGNLVAVISNGTAVLGLGNIGPLASKPVMEGKGVLFKKFAGIDVFDIEINENDPDKLIDVIAALEPTFGGVNLEDIKAPECFYIERKLRERMKIPVFHDDQHGTAIIVGAAILNGLKVVNKDIKNCKLVVSGAGAAALACLDLIVDLGFPIENIFVTDLAGVVYKGRTELMDPDKERFAQDTPHRSLAEVIPGADIFLGLSAGGVLKPDMVAKMAPNPLILALANPNPEILPEDAKAVRRRRDHRHRPFGLPEPGQQRPVLPLHVPRRAGLRRDHHHARDGNRRGACDRRTGPRRAVGHRGDGLRHLEPVVRSGIPDPDAVRPAPADPHRAGGGEGRDGRRRRHPSDRRPGRLRREPGAVRVPQRFLHEAAVPVAKSTPPELKRIVYAEGEEERVLRAVQVVVDEKLARPILVGRPAVLEKRIEKFGLRLKQGVHFDVINPDFDERYRDYWQTYHQMVMRKGVTQDMAKLAMRRRHTLIGAMMIHKGDADGMICGTYGTTQMHLEFIDKVLGLRAGANVYAAMNFVITEERQLAMVDTHVNENPTAEELAEITIMAAEELERFGITPRAALLSHSNFGTSNSESAQKMRAALALVQQKAPGLEVDGEMHGDAALDSKLRAKIMPQSTLKGDANLVVMPNIDAANIAYNLLKTAAGNGIAVGPVLLGCARPVHILTPSATVRRIVNMTACAWWTPCRRAEI
jgi:malate dehydrogenase (oxaloacetate-decarboxylating)(NADP+)